MYLRCKARASLQVRARLLADDVGRAAARRLQPTARDHLGSELSTVVNSDTPPIDRRGPRSTTPGGRNGARWTANLHRESNASQHERLDLVPCSDTLARHRRRSVACAAERRSPVSQVRPEVGGDAVAYCGTSDDEIAAGIADLLADSKRCADLRQRGIERAATFTWARTVDGCVEAYGRAASSR